MSRNLAGTRAIPSFRLGQHPQAFLPRDIKARSPTARSPERCLTDVYSEAVASRRAASSVILSVLNSDTILCRYPECPLLSVVFLSKSLPRRSSKSFPLQAKALLSHRLSARLSSGSTNQL